MVPAYIGLGGNVGDVRASMSGALKLFDQEENVSVNRVSSIYRTPPWGIEDQDWFQNACAELATSLEPEALLELCLATERLFGRERTLKWGPRTLDLDILIFADLEVSSEHLKIPHPRMLERAFVIVPLAEIAPDLQLEGRDLSQWASTMDEEGMEVLVDQKDWWRA